MQNKKTAKLISFSKYALITSIISDEGKIRKMNDSTIIEDYLLKCLVPESELIQGWIENDIYGEGGIRKFFEDLFTYNSMNKDEEPPFQDIYPLLKHIYLKHVRQKDLKCKKNVDDCMHELLQNLNILFNRIRTYKEKLNATTNKDELVHVMELLLQLKDHIEFLECHTTIDLDKYYLFLLDYWKFVKHYTVTYRLIATLLKAEPEWEDTPEERIEIIKALRKSSL